VAAQKFCSLRGCAADYYKVQTLRGIVLNNALLHSVHVCAFVTHLLLITADVALTQPALFATLLLP
jgi:uncharacterized MnhB-related membrane protein